MANLQNHTSGPTTLQQIQYQQGALPLTQPVVTPHSIGQHQPILSQPVQPSTSTLIQQIQSDWTTVHNKKRLRSPEVALSRKQTRLSDYWLQKPIETNNKFSNLSEDGDDENKDTTELNNAPKPPPVTVYNVGVIQHIHELLKKITNSKYTVKTTGYETIKIQVFDIEQFKNLIKELDSKKTQYHTFRPKSEKTFRFVLRGLHHATDTEDIKASFADQGHEVVNVHNIRHRTTKDPLPMFYVDIKPKENNKEVYNIDKLGNNIIKCEPPHTKRIVPQCIRCQSYGHTKTYCRKLAQCVKCAGQHETKNCTRKTRDDKVKCANCGGDHPANYRGCLVHKQLQQKLYPTLRKNRNLGHHTQIESSLQNQPEKSYAQVVKDDQRQNEQEVPTNHLPVNSITKLEEMMSKLMEQMSTMLNLLTVVVSKLA